MDNENTIRLEEDTETTQPEHNSHHHSSHRSSHHHSRKRKRSGSRRKTIKLALTVIGIPLGILLILYLISTAMSWGRYLEYMANPYRGTAQSTTAASSSSSTNPTEAEGLVYIRISTFLEPQDLLGDLAATYMNAGSNTPINQTISEYFGNSSFVRQDYPQGVTIHFEMSGLPEGCTVKQVRAELSESLDFTQATHWTPENNSVTFSNLKTGATYYYKLYFTLSNKIERTYRSSFFTSDGPRLLSIDGIANVRDVGGWKTTDGKTIRQGLLYRGSELDGAVDAAYALTAAGADVMRNALGIRFDMDLRSSDAIASNTHPLGSDVFHKYYGLGAYHLAFERSGKAAMREIFRDLSDPDNYPAYLHCTNGTDSTGTVCLILEALLGVSEEDLIRDYELSALYSGSVSRSDIQSVLDLLDGYDGVNLQQQAESYLLSCGVTEAEIDSIRSIFLG